MEPIETNPATPAPPQALRTLSRGQVVRQQFRKHRLAVWSLWLLGLLYVLAAFADFIARNYEADEHGRWFFQNGPQRVFVDLELAPLVLGVVYRRAILLDDFDGTAGGPGGGRGVVVDGEVDRAVGASTDGLEQLETPSVNRHASEVGKYNSRHLE